jgi:hypothetical protein
MNCSVKCVFNRTNTVSEVKELIISNVNHENN